MCDASFKFYDIYLKKPIKIFIRVLPIQGDYLEVDFLRGFFEKKMDYNGFHGYGYGVDDLIVTIDDLINYDPSTIQQEVEQIPDFFDQFAKQFDKDFVVYSRCAHYKMVFADFRYLIN